MYDFTNERFGLRDMRLDRLYSAAYQSIEERCGEIIGDINEVRDLLEMQESPNDSLRKILEFAEEAAFWLEHVYWETPEPKIDLTFAKSALISLSNAITHNILLIYGGNDERVSFGALKQLGKVSTLLRAPAPNLGEMAENAQLAKSLFMQERQNWHEESEFVAKDIFDVLEAVIALKDIFVAPEVPDSP